ncbi:hypothetical protein DXT76_11530, partial [Halobacillus trueperi]
TPQDAVRGGSPRSRGKRVIPRSPNPPHKHLETKSSRKGSVCGRGIIIYMSLAVIFKQPDFFYKEHELLVGNKGFWPGKQNISNEE